MKPRLTERVLDGILKIEPCCGGMLEPDEMVAQGLSARDRDDAKAAQRWAAEMLKWRAEKKGGAK